MGNLDIGKATASDMTNAVEDLEVSAATLDSPTGTDETTYHNTKWSTYLGHYKNVPEVKIAIDMRAIWTVGRGWETDDPRTHVVLDNIKGTGIDTFNTILKNMIVCARIGGDAFAEIIWDPKRPITVLNLKPLDPSSIVIVVDKKGIIKRYEQISRVKGKPNIKFDPKDIFHLSNKRVGDEIHGISDVEALIPIINANYESFGDIKKLMHRYVKPMMKFILDTDDQTKIDALIAKFDAAVNKGENMYIPKGTVEQDLIAVPPNATLNPLPWREHLRTYFYQVVGIPQIVLGNAAEFSESSAKIAYLAFQQSVESEQLDIQEQIWNQLFMKVKLTFPASLFNNMLSDQSKDGKNQQTGFQQSDVTAGAGGV